MNNRQLENIIKEIQKGEGVKLAEIAKNAGVNRSYLSTLINATEVKDIDDAFTGKIARGYPVYFNVQQKQTPKPTNADPDIVANLKELRGFAISMLAAQEAQHKIMLESLERIEGKKPGELTAYADTLTVMMLQRLHIVQAGIYERRDSEVQT